MNNMIGKEITNSVGLDATTENLKHFPGTSIKTKAREINDDRYGISNLGC